VYFGRHPPIPTLSKQFVGNLLFLVLFMVPNFRRHFEGLNVEFSRPVTLVKLLINTFPKRYFAPQMEIICKSYAPRKLIQQTTQNGVHKTVGFSSFGVRVFGFLYDKNSF
jgi:hypothetical protein